MKHEPFNFDRLNSLKDGWLGEGSFAPTAVGLQWLTHVLEMYPDDMAPRPLELEEIAAQYPAPRM
jgi:hypothetical protein